MSVFTKDCLTDYVLLLAGGGNNVSFGTPGGNGIPQPSFGGSTPSFNVGTGNNQKARPVRKPVRRTKRT